jgi:hypothetical protein
MKLKDSINSLFMLVNTFSILAIVGLVLWYLPLPLRISVVVFIISFIGFYMTEEC